jgi:hypothetical protein
LDRDRDNEDEWVCDRWKLITPVKLPSSLVTFPDHLNLATFLIHVNPFTQNPFLILASLSLPTTSHVGIPVMKLFDLQTLTSTMPEELNLWRMKMKKRKMMMVNMGRRGDGGLMSLRKKLMMDMVAVGKKL